MPCFALLSPTVLRTESRFSSGWKYSLEMRPASSVSMRTTPWPMFHFGGTSKQEGLRRSFFSAGLLPSVLLSAAGGFFQYPKSTYHRLHPNRPGKCTLHIENHNISKKRRFTMNIITPDQGNTAYEKNAV